MDVNVSEGYLTLSLILSAAGVTVWAQTDHSSAQTEQHRDFSVDRQDKLIYIFCSSEIEFSSKLRSFYCISSGFLVCN